jgi:hypothetical protein
MYHVLWPIGFGGASVHGFKDAAIPFSPLARQKYRLDDWADLQPGSANWGMKDAYWPRFGSSLLVA